MRAAACLDPLLWSGAAVMLLLAEAKPLPKYWAEGLHFFSPVKICALNQHVLSYPNLSLTAQPCFLIPHYPGVSIIPADPLPSCPAHLSRMQAWWCAKHQSKHPHVSVYLKVWAPSRLIDERKLSDQGLPGGKKYSGKHQAMLPDKPKSLCTSGIIAYQQKENHSWLSFSTNKESVKMVHWLLSSCLGDFAHVLKSKAWKPCRDCSSLQQEERL